MAFATTTCAYSNPVGTDGITPPSAPTDTFAFASSTCVAEYAESTTTVEFALGDSAENPLIVRDDGSIVFGLGILIFLALFVVLGILFPSGESRKRSNRLI